MIHASIISNAHHTPVIMTIGLREFPGRKTRKHCSRILLLPCLLLFCYEACFKFIWLKEYAWRGPERALICWSRILMRKPRVNMVIGLADNWPDICRVGSRVTKCHFCANVMVPLLCPEGLSHNQDLCCKSYNFKIVMFELFPSRYTANVML